MGENFDRARRFGDEVLGRSVDKVESGGHERGFADAAEIVLHLVQTDIAALRERVKQGSGSSDASLLVQLEELKERIEGDFDAYWSRTDVDWRRLLPD